MSGGRQYEKIDPAALLVAVIAVTIQTIGTKGAWSPIGTITAVVIGVIVFCFTWPHAPQVVEGPDYWIITAQSLVFGLIGSVAFAWPAQSLFAPGGCVWNPTDTNCQDFIVKQGYDGDGTWLGLLAGLVITVVFWFLLLAATKRRMPTPQPPVPAPDGAV